MDTNVNVAIFASVHVVIDTDIEMKIRYTFIKTFSLNSTTQAAMYDGLIR